MKNVKTKLLASVVMLLIAAIMMSTASYAWFTISTNPEIANISANITANGNLEIALDAGTDKEPNASTTSDSGKNTTWGNLIDAQKAFIADGTNTNDTVTLKPVQFLVNAGAVTVNKPNYGLDGRIKSLTALTRRQCNDVEATDFNDLGGIWFYTDSTATGKQAAGTYDASIYAFEVDYWLRTNTAGTVSLLGTDGTGRAQDKDDTYDGEMGLGSFITDEKNVTVLFCDTNSGNAATGTKNQTWYIAERGAVADGKYPITLAEVTVSSTGAIEKVTSGKTNITFVKDLAKEIKMYVFMDGAKITNADALATVTEFIMNVQFTHSTDLNAMDVQMSEHGRYKTDSITDKVTSGT